MNVVEEFVDGCDREQVVTGFTPSLIGDENVDNLSLASPTVHCSSVVPSRVMIKHGSERLAILRRFA